MKFLIITNVKHKMHNDKYFAYSPYVREMNIWIKYVDELKIVAPLRKDQKTIIDKEYVHSKIDFHRIPEIEFTSVLKAIISFVRIPLIVAKIFTACLQSDHIHLRCPGNIGLLGCFVQVFFPGKTKTAKYAGNWDPQSIQPFSYKVQKNILKNTFLTRNMQALVYGNWQNQTKNIRPFFTASYHENEIEKLKHRNFEEELSFIFVGALVKGKRPILTVKIVEALNEEGVKSRLDLYGDGLMRPELENYIDIKGLKDKIRIHGNISQERLKIVFKLADFLILPSKSEGWPKAVAEAMFFGVIPITTQVSCLNYMLDEGRRGILIDGELDRAVRKIKESIKKDSLLSMSVASQQWSQKITLEKFETEIKKLIVRE
ncbi:MAG: glycosyltransferase family 4 protein [Bacteroidia bacterium]|nr:glycosyltransferase family 4 protein [Bacteroidia bacterium]